MGFLLNTNIVSDLVRHPRGRVATRIADVGPQQVYTSIIVTAELRYGVARKGSARLSAQVDAVLRGLNILAFEPPSDAVYGELRAGLERIGKPIGANDMLVAAQALALRHTVVTDNEREFSRIEGLAVENWLR
jgi:tRNA(fMet)-specific endonuclease VapC